MKKVSGIIVLLSILAIVSCKKNDGPSVQPINIIVKAIYDTTSGNYSFPLNGITIKIKNQLNSSELTQSSDNNGLAIFNSVSAGVYNIEATISIQKAQYETITGLPLDRDSVVFNASLSNIMLNNSTNNTLELKLQFGKIGDWVIKQVYYAGSHTTNGAVYRDQFIEVYNNSNTVLYADSLYIGEVMGNNTANPNYATGYFINDGPFKGQYDWSKSIGMPANSNAVESYVYAKSLYRVPGNGTTYPIQPGQSFVMAQTALNHKAPYTSSTGTTISIKDPTLTVDLSGAEFEVYVGNVISNPLNSDIDNPNVPNLVPLTIFGRDWLLDNPGRDAFVIFKTAADIPADWKKYPNPTVTAIDANTDFHYQIPNTLIIDAMEVQHATPSSRVAKRLVGTLDAGAYNVPAGQYSSQSAIRKTAKTVSGRKILMDTNNSTNDFDYFEKANPKGFK
ncbi:DUF4876 domain-containing protein [Pseudoflavitalea sp. X16]|uniref:DUF4876 domain-containing protein n=1 Tax=Paraflavitalea devenefica TaxID=2716334 RepID=UPI0014203F93|nr:DUF4876 domain-containing protein [Paraflavitalea devenefica]NII28094.1 DUF4876 domain-containing protein [Paraflavitalea devenefica]